MRRRKQIQEWRDYAAKLIREVRSKYGGMHFHSKYALDPVNTWWSDEVRRRAAVHCPLRRRTLLAILEQAVDDQVTFSQAIGR